MIRGAPRWLIAAGAVIAIVIAIVLGAGVVAAAVFDPASQKDRIVQAVRRATGRDLTLAGPVRLAWGFSPTLEAEDVSFANMAGGTRPQMVTVARMEVQLRLLPILTGQIELARATLVRPDILLETDADGRANWQFPRPAASPGPAPASSPGPRLTTRLDSVRVQSGRLTWHDGVSGRTVTADVPNAVVDLGDGPAHIVAEALTAGTPVRLDATVGTFARLTAAPPVPWPVKLAAAAGDATVAIEGTADPAAHSFAGRIEAKIPDLTRLGTLFGRSGLPALHDIRIAGTLPQAGGLPQDVTLVAGASDLGTVLAGATLAHLAFTWPAGQPARLEADGMVGTAPWHVASGGLPAGQGVALRALVVTTPFGDVAGDLAVTAFPRPALRGTLVANRIDADAIRAAVLPRAATPASAVPPAAAPIRAAAPAPGPIFSDTPLPWAVLRMADTDLQATIGTLRLGGADYRTATGHIVAQDGVVRLDSASVVSPGGRFDFSASTDARAPAPPVVLVARSAAMSLDPILQAAGLPGGSDAVAELDVTLQAAGATPHALAATLGGHVGIAMVDGEIANAALAATLGDLVKQAGAGLDPGGRSHVRCLAIRADATQGVVVLSALKLDTARLTLDGSGTLNLGDETMALRLRPLLRLGGAGVSAPLRADGPIRHPAVTLDPAAAGRTSLVIGGLAGPADTCAAELAAARDGHSGRLPAEAAATKPPKAADLLRSLLR